MKTLLTLALLGCVPAYAGSKVSDVVYQPTPEPCLFTWFAGGSVGYLTEMEEPMYHLHFGTDTCWQPGGWKIAFFGEVGYFDTDDQFNRGTGPGPGQGFGNGDTLTLGQLGSLLNSFPGMRSSYDLEVLPITANVKFEKAFTQNLSGYLGAGVGMARVSLDVNTSTFGNFSDSDWTFVAQAFAGLTYNVNERFEVYGGGRYIYFDDADLSSRGVRGSLDLGDDWLVELGARFNF